jgi:hypothetical protein
VPAEESHEAGRVGERIVYAEVWHSAALVVLEQRAMRLGEPEVRLTMTPFEARKLGGILIKAAADAEHYAKGGIP